MRRRAVLLGLIMFLILAVLPMPSVWGGGRFVSVGTAQLGFEGQYVRVCDGKLIVVGKKQLTQSKTVEMVAILDLSDPSSPKVVAEGQGPQGGLDVPITDLVCTPDKLMVMRNGKDSPWLPVRIYSLPDLSYVEPPAKDWQGLSGIYVADSWKFEPGVYALTPFSGESLMVFYPDKGGMERVQIDTSAVPPLDAATVYPKRVFLLSEDTLLLIGQGGYVVKMSDATHGKVVSYFGGLPTGGSEPVFFSERAQRIGNLIVGWDRAESAEPTGFYFYDISQGKAYYKAYQGATEPEKLASFGSQLYALVEHKGDGTWHRLFILNVRSGDVWTMDLSHGCVDVAVWAGIVYLLTGDELDIYAAPVMTDVGPDYWAYTPIAYLMAKGVIAGYPDGSFKPDKPVSRAEYAKMLATVMKLKVEPCSGFNEFSDVKDSDWFCPYVKAVYRVGYMIGMGDGTFAPKAQVKKEEILTTIVRIRKWELCVPETPTFSDIPLEYWAYPYVETAVKHGIIAPGDTGLVSGRVFGKGQPATRAQTAVLIYRGLGLER